MKRVILRIIALGLVMVVFAAPAAGTGETGADSQVTAAEQLVLFKTPGCYVEFGHYPQTEEGTDSTLIEWLVVEYDAENDRALLLSRYGLDAKAYNTEYTEITWEGCTLRSWLNGEFLNKAFSEAEQGMIDTTTVDNSKSQGYSKWCTNGGNNTQDRVFLLSYAEANKYLNVTHDDSKNTKSRVQPTAYAIKQGVWTSGDYKTPDGNAAGWWWLRSPGNNQNGAAGVSPGGFLHDSHVVDGDICVRSVLWIDLDSTIF